MAQELFVHFISTQDIGVMDPGGSISCDEAFAVVAAAPSPGYTSLLPCPVYPVRGIRDRIVVNSSAGIVSGGFAGVPYAVLAQPAELLSFLVLVPCLGIYVATHSTTPPNVRIKVVNPFS
jgi:hypothetical protein